MPGEYVASFKPLKEGTYYFEFIASDDATAENGNNGPVNKEFALTAKHSIYVSKNENVKNWTAYTHMQALEEELLAIQCSGNNCNLDRKTKSAIDKSLAFFVNSPKKGSVYTYFYGYPNNINGNKLITSDKSEVYFFDALTSIANYLTDIVGSPLISVNVKDDLIYHLKEAAFKVADYALKEATMPGVCQQSNCGELEKNALEELGKGLRGYEDDLFVNSINHYTNAYKFALSMMGVDFKKVVASATANIPTEYTIAQNYPNPFNPSTQIKFGLPENNHVKLEVFDLLGNLVTTLADETMDAGYHVVNWNASNYTSGVYFYRITSGTFIKTMKLMLLK